jgi:hypothetical protein
VADFKLIKPLGSTSNEFTHAAAYSFAKEKYVAAYNFAN